MYEEFKESHFSVLPNEILIKILANIDIFTLLNFCSVYDCDYFIKDRNVLRILNLCKAYTLPDLSSISKKIDFNNVTTLNINCLYWITASKLRSFVSKLVNLQVLYAIKTNINLTPPYTEVFSRLKIRKLGISIHRTDDFGSHRIPTIETLYLDFISMPRSFTALTIESIFPNIRKLWIEVEEVCGHEMVLHSLQAETKSKIYCQVEAPMPFINFEHYCLTTFYNNRRANQPYVMCCEKFSAQQLRSKSIFEMDEKLGSWKVLADLHCSKPYGPKDARRLILNENTLDDIYFEELNFFHSGPVCNTRCRDAVDEILQSRNAQKLKKLCIMMCQLQNKNSQESVPVQDNIFQRKRRGVANSATSHSVEKLFRNFINLQHLEIYSCLQIPHHTTIQAYPLISLLENLQSLIIDIPTSLDGSFLIEVLKKCRNLQQLKLKTFSQQEKVNFNINQAMTHAVALKDFRYENSRIQLDNLMESLCTIPSPKLERIVLFCKSIDRLSRAPFCKFLHSNPQLIFLYFVLPSCTLPSMRLIKQIIKNFADEHPCKVFVVNKSSSSEKSGYPVPDVHYFELVKNSNSVASLNAMEDFVYF